MSKSTLKRLGMETEMRDWIKKMKSASFRVGDRVKLMHPARQMGDHDFSNILGIVREVRNTSGKEFLIIDFEESIHSGPWFSSRFKRI